MGPRNARNLTLEILVPPWGAKGAKKEVSKTSQKRDPQQIDFFEPEGLPAGDSGGGRWERRGARGGKEGTSPSEIGRESREPAFLFF